MSRNGAFVLACSSGNFNLAEHVLNVALTAVSPTSFLGGEPNNILKALLFAVEAFDVSAALKVMNMCHGWRNIQNYLKLLRSFSYKSNEAFILGVVV